MTTETTEAIRTQARRALPGPTITDSTATPRRRKERTDG